MSRPVLILTLEQAAAIEALRRDWRDGRPLEHAVIRLLQTFPVPGVPLAEPRRQERDQ